MSELLKNYVNDKRAFSVYDVPEVEKVGIYAIYNRRNKRYYIGSATNIYVRLSSHSVDIRLHGGINLKMAEDINSLQDINDFVFLIIQTFDDNSITLKELRAYERMYIKEFNAATDGYNTDATPYNSGRIKPNTLLSSRKTIGQKSGVLFIYKCPKARRTRSKRRQIRKASR